MMIDLCNKLVDNELTKEDLLGKIEICKTSKDDFEEICNTLAKAFNLSSPSEAKFQLNNGLVNLDESVKLIDRKTKEIYGLLIFCEYPISIGSPIMFKERNLGLFLDRFKQLNGHSFVIDERLRGCGVDKQMLYFNNEFIKEQYDILWIAVENSLRTHNYWKRLGFIEVFEIDEATFYMIPLNKKVLGDIY